MGGSRYFFLQRVEQWSSVNERVLMSLQIVLQITEHFCDYFVQVLYAPNYVAMKCFTQL
jgi:hypothetical protein